MTNDDLKVNTVTNYTIIPQETKDKYDNFFTVEYIKEHYNGDVLKACEDHPSYFAWFMFNIKVRIYQFYMHERMIKNKFILSVWGRRMGKTISFKTFASWALRYNKYPQGADQTTKIVVIAHTQESADGYIDEIRQFFFTGDAVVKDKFKGKLGVKYFSSHFPKKGGRIRDNASQLAFFNKGWNKIKSFPPTTKARGEPASIVIMDELAFWRDYTSLQKDEYAIYNEVIRPIPTDSPDTKIFGATTPSGSEGIAYDLMSVDDHKTRYDLIWFPYYYRRDKEYLEEMKFTEEEYRDQGRYNEFRQEYLAELISKTSGYFDKEEEIDKVFNDHSLQQVFETSSSCDMGIDFGGSAKSRTVITISYYDVDSDTMIRIYHRRYPLREDSTLPEDILELSKKFNIRKYHIDSQGGGSSFYATFRKMFGDSMIDEVSFRKEKVNVYRQFKVACFKDRIKSYQDKVLYEEFNGFTADLKPSRGKTDDMLDSFMMSVKDWLIEKKENKYGIIRY